MKKLVFQCLVAALCVSCTGIGGSGTPAGAAEKFCKAILKKDAKALAGCVYVDQSLVEKSSATIEDMCNEMISWINGDKNPMVNYKIGDVELSDDGKSAKVTMTMICKDGKTDTDKAPFIKTDKGWKADMMSDIE